MKTENEIQNVIDWLGKEDADDPSDDLSYIENVRAFKEALHWVLNPPTILTSAMCTRTGISSAFAPLISEYVVFAILIQ